MITRFVDQVGASGLQTKIQTNKDKLLTAYEQDLGMAEEASNSYKDQLAALNMELAEATAVLQSISSSRATITGSGGESTNSVVYFSL